MDFKIKQIPEDFRVAEKYSLKPGKDGVYGYYNLIKTSYTTQRAIETIARRIRKRSKFFNYSGNKDKYAVTEQLISILHGPARDVEMKDIKLVYLGRGSERINLGTAEENTFEITVRNIDKLPKAIQVPNYYDDQRFGMNGNNHIIGKLLLQKKFKEACKLIPETEDHLIERPSDYVSALRRIPKRILRLYPHAYQSYLWNVIVSKEIQKGKHKFIETASGKLAIPLETTKNKKINIVGYDTKITKKEKEILNKEEIKQEDFKVKEIQEFDLSGESRDMLIEVKNLEISKLEEDDLNTGKKKCTLKFTLPKGAYATTVIKAFFI